MNLFTYKLPNLKTLKVFGSLYLAFNLERNKSKLDPEVRRCIFIEYKSGMKEYIILDIKTKEVLISKDVIFYEKTFPYKRTQKY